MATVVRKAERCLAILKKTVISKNFIIVKLYKQLVRPHLEYATPMWKPYSKRDIQLLERVQKHATKCVNGLANKNYEERLVLLKMDTLKIRRTFFDLLEVFKIVVGICVIDFDKIFNLIFERINSLSG